MAKQVVWSLRAQEDRKQILYYWNQRNKSSTYSKKLNKLFKESIKIILDFPEIGKLTDSGNARIKIVRDYLLIYEASENQVVVLSIWDTRQDPEKLKKILL
jgi:addiction module RelE/StbE family toxin